MQSFKISHFPPKKSKDYIKKLFVTSLRLWIKSLHIPSKTVINNN